MLNCLVAYYCLPQPNCYTSGLGKFPRAETASAADPDSPERPGGMTEGITRCHRTSHDETDLRQGSPRIVKINQRDRSPHIYQGGAILRVEASKASVRQLREEKLGEERRGVQRSAGRVAEGRFDCIPARCEHKAGTCGGSAAVLW